MIYTNLGKVKTTQPNYKLCELLNMPKSEVNNVTEAILGADLMTILDALAGIFGTEHAMEIWTHVAEAYIEDMKGETP